MIRGAVRTILEIPPLLRCAKQSGGGALDLALRCESSPFRNSSKRLARSLARSSDFQDPLDHFFDDAVGGRGAGRDADFNFARGQPIRGFDDLRTEYLFMPDQSV